MARNTEDSPALPDGYEADRLEQELPAVPEDGPDVGAPAADAPLEGGSDADRHEQQLPAVPGGGSTPPAGDDVLPGGSEADRLEQAQALSGADDDDYPYGVEDEAASYEDAADDEDDEQR
ncbi:hypothetical protein BN1051_02639 [Arthrobacter saudimassiliensis]|uniref:DUF5709 domain-containing protein n=1 Tax=Arthrobacter saudimassiliensis TaxID=1461584 RepID=A0A078MWR8_9MICC|nr:hypothetical protein BN1051_02639 [Arthrobacter saudimassiliensis]